MAQFDFYGTELDALGWFRQLLLLGRFRLLRADPPANQSYKKWGMTRGRSRRS